MVARIEMVDVFNASSTDIAKGQDLGPQFLLEIFSGVIPYNGLRYTTYVHILFGSNSLVSGLLRIHAFINVVALYLLV